MNNEKHSPIEPETNQLFCGRCGKPAIRGKNIGDHCGQFFDIEKNGMFCSGTIVEPTPLQPVKDEMLPCPFCGGEPEINQTGKNELTLKCKSCVIGIKQRVLRNDLDWLRNKMIEDWNKRFEPSSKEQEGDAVGFIEWINQNTKESNIIGCFRIYNGKHYNENQLYQLYKKKP